MSFNEGNLHEEVERLRKRVEELEAKLHSGQARTLPAPEDRTCENCDWYCYGTWDGNTCDKWEYKIAEIVVPDDVIAMITGQPTSHDIEALKREIDEMERP